MTELEAILQLPPGAQFYRADLHIHSAGASHDVRDLAMTPEAIVDTAAAEGLAIIAITDHNDIDNVGAGIAAGAKKGVLVIPGVELSTAQGHLLCYLPTHAALKKFFGKLDIADVGKQNSRCQQAILDCLNLLADHDGFGVLAHVDTGAGYETENPGGSPHKVDVLCHRALRGIELKNATSDISYSPSDTDSIRHGIGKERIKRLGLGANQWIARVLNSDAHGLAALGHNAQSLRRVTRYKMDTPSFDALAIALDDADARVRIEDLIPPSIPRILGLSMSGGFLADQRIQFGQNLNCIIGGRGTGKSLTFEAVRVLAPEASESTVLDTEVWPDGLDLYWQDRAGQVHHLTRGKLGGIENADDPDMGPIVFDIDCFGQGDAARISIKAQTDPLALLNYLDRFIGFGDAEEVEAAAREKLLALQTAIEEAEGKVRLVPEYERMLATTRQQLTALQKPEVKDLIELSRKVAQERELRTQITERLTKAKQGLSQPAKKMAGEIRALADPAKLAVGADEFKAIAAAATTFEAAVTVAETQLSSSMATFEAATTAQIAAWRTKDAEAQRKIDDKRKELEALKIAFDMSYIAKLAADEAAHAQAVTNLNTWKPHLADLRKQRTTTLAERWAARDRVATLRDAFGRQASKILKESLSDLMVSLKYDRNAHSPDGCALIIGAMGWRTNQQPRADYLVEKLTVPKLLEAVAKNDPAPLLALKTPENVPVFKRDEVLLILEKLKDPAQRYALERVAIYDLPRLIVTKEVPDGTGGKNFTRRDFSRLSLGQQQSVLLALILSSDSDRPLIIDQPEDNLDGEFIYSTLVPVLRRAKERRQVIIVTHNANVAVLGDAEQIVVMKAVHDKGQIVATGSIDQVETRDAACAILEGAADAFVRRGKIYGLRVEKRV